jgi:predicted ArsR family transcriptional regulator
MTVSPRLVEVFSLFKTGPITRHAISKTLCISYDCAAMHVAALQAMGFVAPCGHERTPGRRTYRMLFKAVSK